MAHNVPWKSFSGGDSGPPAELEGAGVVVLVPAGDPVWPGWAALELARSMARSGRRVFLCDLGLSSPGLHTVAGVARGEGVSDFILYGASPGHVATELEERLLFVSAGTPVAAVESVCASDRWDGFLEASSHAGACVMIFAPSEVPGADRMFARADSLVVLGSRDGALSLENIDVDRAVGLEPVPTPTPVTEADPLPGDPATMETSDPARSSGADDPWEFDPPAIGRDPDDEPVVTAEPAAAVNRAARLSPPPKSRFGLWFFLIFVLIVAIVAAGWYGLIEVPGISPRRSAGTPEGTREASAQVVDDAALPQAADVADEAVGSEDPSPAPDVAAPLQAWGLRIGAFRSQGVARQQVGLMSGRAPDHLFIVVPVDVQDTRWYRVVSALAEERADGESMRSDLAARLGSAEAEQWLVRRAPWTFLLAETSTEEQARARLESLSAAGLDSFVMALPRSDGSTVFRVYAGAYADSEEASAMQALLEAAGIADAPLVERRGILPE